MRHLLLLYFLTAERFIALARFGRGKAMRPTVDAIALRRSLRFNRRLNEPLPVEEVKQMLDTFPERPQRSETIAKTLEITMKQMLACGLTSLIPPDVRRRQQNMKVAERNARDRRAACLDLFAVNGMPVMCIAKLTGNHRSTVSRYIDKVERQGVALFPRASLQGLKRGR
jgi:hypothetical protein